MGRDGGSGRGGGKGRFLLWRLFVALADLSVALPSESLMSAEEVDAKQSTWREGRLGDNILSNA